MSKIDVLDAAKEAAEEAAWAYQDQVCQALRELCPTLDWVERSQDTGDMPHIKIWLQGVPDQIQVSTHDVLGEEGQSIFTTVEDLRTQVLLPNATKDWPLFCRILAHWMAADIGTVLDLTAT